MRKVYEAGLITDAEQLRDILRRRGIEAFVFGEHTFSVLGVNPLAWPQVWVADDEDYDRAKALVREYEQARGVPDTAGVARQWRCRGCGEINEDTFELCWRCGSPHP